MSDTILLISIIILVPLAALGILVFLSRMLIRRFPRVGTGLVVAFWSFLSYQIVTAIYPPKSFYLDEFKYYTGVDFPSDSQFIYKNASYPDFHGDYSLSFSAEVSDLEKERLKKELNLGMNKELLYHTEPYRNELETSTIENIEYELWNISDEIGETHFTGILKNSNTVVFWVSKT